MSYLTLEEYNSFDFEEISDQKQFDKFLKTASLILDNLTRRFYVYKDLENDWKWRKEAFKGALASQVNYMLTNNETTTDGLNNTPQTQSIGRISITQKSNTNGSGHAVNKSLLCPDVYMYLEGTGLLNRSVGKWY